MKRAIAIKVGCLSLLVIFIRLSGLFPVLEFGPVTAEGAGPFEGMVLIPGGPFTMGRDNGPETEKPGHRVYLPAFYIDKNLVTVAD